MKEQTTTDQADWNSFSFKLSWWSSSIETNADRMIHSSAFFFLRTSSFFRCASLLNTWKFSLSIHGNETNKTVVVVITLSSLFIARRRTLGKERARENTNRARKEEREKDWRIVYVCAVCYRRNMAIHWLPATSRESKCMCMRKLERKKWEREKWREREWENKCPYIKLCVCSLSIVRLSLSFSSTSDLLFFRQSSSKQQTTNMREIVHSKSLRTTSEKKN